MYCIRWTADWISGLGIGTHSTDLGMRTHLGFRHQHTLNGFRHAHTLFRVLDADIARIRLHFLVQGLMFGVWCLVLGVSNLEPGV